MERTVIQKAFALGTGSFRKFPTENLDMMESAMNENTSRMVCQAVSNQEPITVIMTDPGAIFEFTVLFQVIKRLGNGDCFQLESS